MERMRPLSAVELMHLWEQGQSHPGYRRALMLLEAALPSIPPEALAQLSLGQRDARLLSLREGVFGPTLASQIACPRCAEALEISLNTGDIRADAPEESNSADPEELLSFSKGDYEMKFRLPNSLDLARTEGATAEASRQQLLEHCLVTVHHADAAVSLNQLPEEVLSALEEQMAQADPQAEIQVELNCRSCGHHWRTFLDIVSFFWSELDAWALRTLREVHLLAFAYGWHEADILAMGPWRRQLYLEMVSR